MFLFYIHFLLMTEFLHIAADALFSVLVTITKYRMKMKTT